MKFKWYSTPAQSAVQSNVLFSNVTSILCKMYLLLLLWYFCRGTINIIVSKQYNNNDYKMTWNSGHSLPKKCNRYDLWDNAALGLGKVENNIQIL